MIVVTMIAITGIEFRSLTLESNISNSFPNLEEAAYGTNESPSWNTTIARERP